MNEAEATTVGGRVRAVPCWAVLLCALAGVGPIPVAHAQRDTSVDRFTPSLDTEGFLAVQGTRTPGTGRYTLALSTDYASDLLGIQQQDAALDVLAHRVTSRLAAQLGLGARFAVAASVPLVWYQSGDSLGDGSAELPAYALGDPALILRYRFLGDASEGPGALRDGPGLALQLGALLPAGERDAYLGEEQVRLRAELLADFHLLGAGIGASVGWLHRFEERQLFDLVLRHELSFGLGLRAPVPPLHPLVALLEVRAVVDFEQSIGVEGELGLRATLGDVTLGLAGGAGLSGGVGTPGARVVLSLVFAPSEADADGDGVPDDVDECPPLPEDLDGFQDGDGCPDPDNDNDLIPDADDLCPNEEAEIDRDDDEDGCTDP